MTHGTNLGRWARRPLLRDLSLFAAFLAAFGFAAPALAAAKADAGGPPPLIDREAFFGDPEISQAQLSPDGKFVAFAKPFKGVRNLWVKRADESFDKAHPITADSKRPIPGYFWSRDGKFVLFVQDQAGDENYNVFAVDPNAKPAAGQEVPAARNLTEAQGITARIYAVPKTEPDTVFVGLNDRDKAWHDLYRVTISTGERTLIRQNTDRLESWVFDLKGQLRLAVRSAENGDTEVLRVDPDKFTKVYSCSVFETCQPARYHKDGKRVYMIENKGEADLARLILFDPGTGKVEFVESDPEKRVDLGAPLFSDRTDELIGTVYEDERTRRYWRDKGFAADMKFLEKKLPGQDVSPGSMTDDEQLWLVAAGSDLEPGVRYLFDRKTRKLTFQYRVFEKIPREHLAPMKAVRYRSSDGLEIPAFLTLPKGVPPKNLPFIVVPHGGPWYRDSWGYDPLAQFLANRGYAVLQPNFRGSTGYGKKFLDAGNLQWGDKMQDDLTWGAKHFVSQGVADPKRLAIMGGSYGGYATLAGVTFTPDLYAAGVSIVGPSNLNTLLESIPAYWESFRIVFHKRMGDPSTPEGKAQLDRQSPLNSAEKIRTPLLVIQGANDPRVKKAESDRIVIALRDRGFPVEYIVAPDEGHGFARPVNNLAMFTQIEKFLGKHIGGRFQESISPETAQRLAEITVDVKTVTAPKRADAASIGVPKPARDLTPGASRYQAKIEAGGQSISMSVAREIKEEGGQWIVTDTATLPMGEIQDKTILQKGALIVVSRAVKQGPVTIDLAFKDNKATGAINMGGQAKPIAADLGGPLFADGAGFEEVIAALPLAEGFTTRFRNFDLQKQKEKLQQLKVAGVEQVTVPAGAFDAYRVEITSAEAEPGSTTVWVARDTGKVVKTSAVLPEMGGAVMTAERLP